MTPVMNQLVKEGIEMDRQYVCASEAPHRPSRRVHLMALFISDVTPHNTDGRSFAAQTSTAPRRAPRSSPAATRTT